MNRLAEERARLVGATVWLSVLPAHRATPRIVRKRGMALLVFRGTLSGATAVVMKAFVPACDSDALVAATAAQAV